VQGIIWEPDCHPADIALEPDPTDIIVLLRERQGDHGVGVVVAAGSSVMTMPAGELVRFPMLDATDRASSCLRGFAKVPSDGQLFVKVPLAEYNADVQGWSGTVPIGDPVERSTVPF
jgi:hypothetical protein